MWIAFVVVLDDLSDDGRRALGVGCGGRRTVDGGRLRRRGPGLCSNVGLGRALDGGGGVREWLDDDPSHSTARLLLLLLLLLLAMWIILLRILPTITTLINTILVDELCHNDIMSITYKCDIKKVKKR